MTCKSSGQPEDVVIFPLCVPQCLYLSLQLAVHCPAALPQPLIQALPAALVGGDCPVLEDVQLGRAVTAGTGSRQWDTAGGCNGGGDKSITTKNGS